MGPVLGADGQVAILIGKPFVFLESLCRSRRAGLRRKRQRHHEGDDVAGVLRPVQRPSTPLVELFAAFRGWPPDPRTDSSVTHILKQKLLP